MPDVALAREFDRLDEAFAAAAARCGAFEHTLAVAGATVRLTLAGEALARGILPALSHLEVPPGRPPDLSIRLWDTTSAGAALPSSPLLPAPGSVLVPLRDDGTVAVHLQATESILTVLHRDRAAALVAFRSPGLPLWERAAPLRALWQRWLAGRGICLVHAAAVGLPGGAGCLLTGPGGSGKSTTALLCQRAGLALAGDDYVLFEPATSRAWSLYRSAKVDWRRRDLLPAVANAASPWEEKALGFLDGLAGGVGVASILLPRVGGAALTTTAPGSPAEALRDLAPRAVLQVPGGAPLFAALAAAVRHLPCLRLDLGRSGVVDAVAGHIGAQVAAAPS